MGAVGESNESEMMAKVNVTVDTATLSRPPVEDLLRRHKVISYDIAGTETVADRPEVFTGRQSPYQLVLSGVETEEEKDFLE